jgi:hypothetical protein
MKGLGAPPVGELAEAGADEVPIGLPGAGEGGVGDTAEGAAAGTPTGGGGVKGFGGSPTAGGGVKDFGASPPETGVAEGRGAGWNPGAGGKLAFGITGPGVESFWVPELPAGGRLMRTVSRLTPLPGLVAPRGRGGSVILTVSFFGSSLILDFWGNK